MNSPPIIWKYNTEHWGGDMQWIVNVQFQSHFRRAWSLPLGDRHSLNSPHSPLPCCPGWGVCPSVHPFHGVLGMLACRRFGLRCVSSRSCVFWSLYFQYFEVPTCLPVTNPAARSLYVWFLCCPQMDGALLSVCAVDLSSAISIFNVGQK